MSKFLCQTTEIYHVNTEEEAKTAIEEAKVNPQFQLNKYLCEYKEIKSKGEVVDTYYKLTLVKQFNDLKEPTFDVDISYNTSESFTRGE
jgi:hypothetical protein